MAELHICRVCHIAKETLTFSGESGLVCDLCRERALERFALRFDAKRKAHRMGGWRR